MRSRLVIIDGIFRKDSAKVPRVERDQMISALAPDRPDQAHMGGESEAAWRALLDDLVKRGCAGAATRGDIERPQGYDLRRHLLGPRIGQRLGEAGDRE